MMPKMDRVTTFKKLQANAQTTKIPVVFFTANGQEDEINRYIKLGALGVVIKPFNVNSLTNDVLNLLEKYLK